MAHNNEHGSVWTLFLYWKVVRRIVTQVRTTPVMRETRHAYRVWSGNYVMNRPLRKTTAYTAE